jgi:hypothetical protein
MTSIYICMSQEATHARWIHQPTFQMALETYTLIDPRLECWIHHKHESKQS